MVQFFHVRTVGVDRNVQRRGNDQVRERTFQFGNVTGLDDVSVAVYSHVAVIVVFGDDQLVAVRRLQAVQAQFPFQFRHVGYAQNTSLLIEFQFHRLDGEIDRHTALLTAFHVGFVRKSQTNQLSVPVGKLGSVRRYGKQRSIDVDFSGGTEQFFKRRNI